MEPNPLKAIYCKDGPFQGQTRSCVIRRRKAFIPMHTNPFYRAAIYLVTTDNIAVFSHCQKREQK